MCLNNKRDKNMNNLQDLDLKSSTHEHDRKKLFIRAHFERLERVIRAVLKKEISKEEAIKLLKVPLDR